MSEHERGAYAPPTDAPLAFDARQPVRGARPAPLTLILSILVLAAVVAGLFLFYRSGARNAGGPPQTVGVPVGGLKAPPPAEAQPSDPAAGLQIYRSEAGGSPADAAAAPKFAPPPETPAPRTGPPKVVVTPAPAPSVSPPAALRPALPAEPPTPKPVPVAAEPAKATPKAPAEVSAANAKPAPEKHVAEKAAPQKRAAAGGAVVQIGAVSSTAIADKAWSDAVAAAPGLAAGKGKSVEKIEKGGAILYRTAVTGFASKADAQAFCAKLQAAGKSCFVR